MDSKFKGPKWVGNIYQKFEAICHEVDDIVKQDTIKYVENQMNSVGRNVKKFCSDLLPPSGHPVKHVAEDVVIEKNAAVSSKTRTSLQENSVDAIKKISSTVPIIMDPVTSQLSIVSSEHCLRDQLSSQTSMVTLEESDSNLHIGKVDDILTNENSAEDNEEIAKPVLSTLNSPGGEEHSAESSIEVFVHSEYENRPADLSEVELSDELEQESRCGNFSDEANCVSGVSTGMVSTTEPKVMDPGIKLTLVSSHSHLLEKCSPTSMDTLQVSESISCMGKNDGTLINENLEVNNEEFSAEVYAPVLLESTSPGVIERSMTSPTGVFDQSNDENRHADLSKVGLETPALEMECESLQNWTLWDDYVNETECVSGALNSPSEMSFSVVSAENTTEDVGISFFSKSSDKESLRISESSSDKFNPEAMLCHSYDEGVGFVSDFSDVAHDTSAQGWEFESLLDSIAWDNFADEAQCQSGSSNRTSETVVSVVPGENSIEEVGLTSFNCSNAKPLRLSEDSPEKLYAEEMLSHNSSEAAGCVGDMSEVIRDTSAHGVEDTSAHGVEDTSAHGMEFENHASSPSSDNFSDDIQCVLGASKSTSEVACVSGVNAVAEIGLPSFSSSGAKEIFKFTENSPQTLSVENMFFHSSGGNARCVSDCLDDLAPAITMSSENKDTKVQLSSSSSVLSGAEGTSRITETIPLTVPSGNQQVKICESNQHEAVMSSSDTGCLNEPSCDISYCQMESIDLLDKVKIEEKCIDVEDSVLHAISRRARKQRSYKKQIQDAFTSKKRLVKEYEQLAIWFGDVGLDSSQAATSNNKDSGTQHVCDSEWELL